VKPYLHEGSLFSVHVARFDAGARYCDGRNYAEGGITFDAVALDIAPYAPFGSTALISHSRDWVLIRAVDGASLTGISFRRAADIELEWKAGGKTGAAGGRIRARAGDVVTIDDGEFEWVALRPVAVPFMALDDVNVNIAPTLMTVPMVGREPSHAATSVPDEVTTAGLIIAGLLCLLVFWRHSRRRKL
jgi:hypothetical protein